MRQLVEGSSEGLIYGICVSDWVSVALSIPGLGSNAARLHGHDYRVSVCLEGPLVDPGVVMDHAKLHGILRSCVESLDYGVLNDALGAENATAELLAAKIYSCINARLGTGLRLTYVSVCTPRGFCSYVRAAAVQETLIPREAGTDASKGAEGP